MQILYRRYRKKMGSKSTCPIALTLGETWESERTQERYKVLASEEIEVPAGKYHTVKIDGLRTVTEIGQQGAPNKMTSYHTIYWYAPELKGMAKVEREFPDESGALNMKLTEELLETTVTQ